MKKYAVNDANLIALYMLSKSPMTQKKLHKLLYFAYAFYLYINNDDVNDLSNKLFKNEFRGWIHGPVLSSLYFIYKQYGFTPIEYQEEVVLDEEVKQVVDLVMTKYDGFSANELEALTHNEIAWLESREGLEDYEAGYNILKDRLIFQQMVTEYGE